MRFLRAAWAASCVTAVLLSVGQNVLNDTTAAVIAYWEPGDQRSYLVEHAMSGPRAGRSTCALDMVVRDATDSTYAVEVIYRNVKVDSELPEDPHQRAVYTRILHAREGLRVLITTDETGVPLGLANTAEIDEHARVVLHGILDLAVNVDERNAMKAALQDVISTGELAQDALEDVGNLLFPFGVAYITGRVEKVQAEVANPLGGIPFHTQQEFTMTTLDTAQAIAHMHMTQHIDPKAVDDAIEALLETSGGHGLEGEERETLRRTIEGITILETMDIEVDLHGAWTTRTVYQRKTRVRGVESAEQRTYTMQ